jgi:hypothetical protein
MELINNNFPELLHYLKIHGIHDKVFTYDNKKCWLRKKKVFICGGCELSYVFDYLKCIENNIYHTFASNTSMDIFSELHNSLSVINDFSADYYIISQIQLFKSLMVRYQDKKYFITPDMVFKD